MANLALETVLNIIKKPFTLRYPYVKRETPTGFRGKHNYDKPRCTYCGACERACPSKSIVVVRDEKKWSLDLGKCIFCARCQEVCPTKCLVLGNEYELSKKYKESLVMKY